MGIIVSIARCPEATFEALREGRLHPHAYFAGPPRPAPHDRRTVLFLADPIDADKRDPLRYVLDKNWDVILYLLSAERRRGRVPDSWSGTYASPSSWVVMGAQPMHPHPDLEYPLRYSSPEQVRAACESLVPIVIDDLMQIARDASSEARVGVYQSDVIWPNEKNADGYARILNNLKWFYEKAEAENQYTIHMRG